MDFPFKIQICLIDPRDNAIFVTQLSYMRKI